MTAIRSSASESGPRRAAHLLLRALRLRCPHCGRDRLSSSWLKLKLKRACGRCGLVFERGRT